MKNFHRSLPVVGCLLIGMSASAQNLDWNQIESACIQEAGSLDSALPNDPLYNALSPNVGKLDTARKHFLHMKEFLSNSSRVWDEQGIRQTIAQNQSSRDHAIREMQGAYRASALHAACLTDAFLSEMRRTQGAKTTVQTPSSSGRSTQSQSTQEFAEQAINLAQQNQAKAEAQRKKDGRRRNYPELDASSCLTPEVRPGFTGFKNSCPYPVRYTYCALNPKIGTGAAFVDCNKQSGAGSVPANGEDFAHMKGAEGVSLVACKLPATAISRKFENGQLWADCVKLGGN